MISFLFVFSFLSRVVAITPASQIQALEYLYNATDGKNWKWSQNELSDGAIWSFTSPQSDPCNENNKPWQGIKCSLSSNLCRTQSCQITWLKLTDYELNGTLPPQLFTQLTTLQYLGISLSPNLVGLIPSTIGSMSSLLDLMFGFNKLTGLIPTQLSQLTQLETLSLYGNLLSGPIPSQFGDMSKLRLLSLYSNFLTDSLPSELGKLTKLTSLTIDNNQFTGTIPHQFEQLSNLKVLYLYANQLTGSLPVQLTELTNIAQLFLSENQFTGQIPSGFSTLPLLGILYLQTNHLSGTIPFGSELTPQLAVLYLNENQLTGTIPANISKLSKLVTLSLESNKLTGTIPSELSELTRLVSFKASTNRLFGSIPSEFGQLAMLEDLQLNQNLLTGTIPSTLGKLSRLNFLTLSINMLSGTIPSELSLLSGLVSLYLSNNQLNGSLPNEIINMTSLIELSLFSNDFSGTIPSNIGLMNLFSLTLHYNHLTGTIPKLPNLQTLYLHHNSFNGTIPSQLGNLTQLVSLYLSSNDLSGMIPFELGSCSSLEELYLFDNQLTGTIPSTISQLSKLLVLQLHQNNLEGKIKFPLYSLPLLEQLFLHDNQLSGHLFELFSSNNSATTTTSSRNNIFQSPLINFDVSKNFFSSSIPSNLFLLPHLQSISLSSNCFEDKLPSSICEAKEIEVISMDGLGSAEGCPKNLKVPLTSVLLVQMTQGSIPDCVWLLSNLRMLNMAGNGLRGTISSVASMSSIMSMTLSHNYLTGSIPLWLQAKNMSQLDLSHNKLTGDLNGFKKQIEYGPFNDLLINRSLGPSFLDRKLILSVNRLSGELSNTFDKYEKLDILSGNLFGCQNIPSNDKNSEWVSCGSEEYNQTMSLMGVVVGILFFVLIFYGLCLLISYFGRKSSAKSVAIQISPNWLLSWVQIRLAAYQRFLFFARYYLHYDSYFQSILRTSYLQSQISSQIQNSYSSTISFGFLLSNLIKSITLLTFISLLCSLPIYIMKEWDVGTTQSGSNEYVTHAHMYHWMWTMAFLKGNLPAILMLIMLWICLFCMTLFFDLLSSDDTDLLRIRNSNLTRSSIENKSESMEPQSFSSSQSTSSVSPTSKIHQFTVWMIFFVNVCVVGTVHGLYLWSTLLDLSTDVRISIQFGVGLFTFLWSVVILRGSLTSTLKESKSGLWLLTCLTIINCVVIPCFATALSSPSCFQGLIVPGDELSSSYIYQRCLIYTRDLEGPVCYLYIPTVMIVLKFIPPFTYSYQCGSTVLTAFIPIYMYSISLQLLSVILRLLMIYFSNFINYPNWLIALFDGVCLPHSPRSNTLEDTPTNVNISSNQIMIQPSSILANLMNQLILLLTFGLCSPILGCYIMINACLTLFSWLLLIGRFLHLRQSKSSNSTSLQSSFNPLNVSVQSFDHTTLTTSTDPLILLLNEQLQGVNTYLRVCKWPIILTSCVFFTLICWDIAGDKVGWFRALWVPGGAVFIAISLWMWDRLLRSKGLDLLEKCLPSFFLSVPNSQLFSSSRPTLPNALELILCQQSPPSPLRNEDVF